MPKAIRLSTDASTGHCYPPIVPIAASPDVFTNGIKQVRAGDAYPVHCCGDSCHAGVAGPSSPTVFVNGKGMHRTGDSITCGDTASSGSPDVFVGP